MECREHVEGSKRFVTIFFIFALASIAEIFDEENQILFVPLISGQYFKSHFKKRGKMDHTTLDQADLDSPCQELFVLGLGFVVALAVRW